MNNSGYQYLMDSEISSELSAVLNRFVESGVYYLMSGGKSSGQVDNETSAPYTRNGRDQERETFGERDM